MNLFQNFLLNALLIIVLHVFLIALARFTILYVALHIPWSSVFTSSLRSFILQETAPLNPTGKLQTRSL